jgi:uncharacterized protein (TIGR02996 family)
MSDHDAFLAAICENPDDDTPRLVFADWLEERDQPERAAFVRAQIELARTPVWEPFAVLCKWRQTDWLTGNPFRGTLPAVDGFHIEWHPEAFRRGFGWRLNVRSQLDWEQMGPQLLNRVPLGEMHLWGGATTLDDWRRFAASSVVRQLRRVHLMSSPIEPLRAIRENPEEALGITDLFFDRASGAGMPEVVEDLLASPLGQVLRGLHFRVGYEALNLLMEMLGAATKLERLSFTTMGLTNDVTRRLTATGALRHLTELHLHSEYSLGNEGVFALAVDLPPGLQDLTCSYVGVKADGVEAIARAEQLTSLRRLNLSQNQLSPRAAKVLAASRSLVGLRSLILNKCRLGDKGVRHLIRSKFWRNLVELDLRDNPISRAGVGYLLDAAIPPDLTALVLDYEQIGTASQNELRKKYGERLVLSHVIES